MKNPYIIKNAQGHYWLASDGEFIQYDATDMEAACDGMGLTPMEAPWELLNALLTDPFAVQVCVDAGPCLPRGHRYWDGRYSMWAVVHFATEINLWVKLDGRGGYEEITKRFYDYHMDAGVYSLPA